MNTAEAQRVLKARLAKLRALSYRELVARVDSVLNEEIARDGERSWQLEFEVLWDDEPEGNVRVNAMIDDGGLRSFVPLTASFVKAPSGEFVDE
jgi:hypothetical protein